MSRYKKAENFYYRGDYYYVTPELPMTVDYQIVNVYDVGQNNQIQNTFGPSSAPALNAMKGVSNGETGDKCRKNCEKCQVENSKRDPKFWGPRYWFTLHNGAYNYPEYPLPEDSKRMKEYILGIPVTLPCPSCQDHAQNFIDANYSNLDNICSSRTNLFNFFVDFHNSVNKRTGKTLFTYEQAMELYK